MKKLSYYTLFSDTLNSRGDSVLFCSRSGESFVVNKELKTNLLEERFDLIPDPIIEKLIASKGIVLKEENELFEIREENKKAIRQNDDSELYIVIQPSANCQLGCYYCGQNHTKNYLTEEYSRAIVERIRGKLMAGNYKSLFIGWFGGEPLMGLPQLRELTNQFKKLAEEFNIRYASKIVTNGLSLKSKIFEELVVDLNVTQIEVTLDGPAEFHDTHRYTKEGKNSFELIYKNLTEIFKRDDYEKLGCFISIRCNVDRKNWEGVSPLIKLLANDGFQKKVSHFYVIGIYSWAGNDAHTNSLTKEEFASKEIDWLIEMFEAGFNPRVIPSRQKQVCAVVSPSFEMYDTFGNVFNCTEVSFSDTYEKTPYALGNLSNPKEISERRPLSDWNETILTDKFPCHTCKMLPVCGGGCPKSWHEDMRACPSAKFNIKERLALGYVLTKAKITELL